MVDRSWLILASSNPLTVVIIRLDRMIQYSRAPEFNRNAAAYWIPAFAGMTVALG
jgi:hypothetical protein